MCSCHILLLVSGNVCWEVESRGTQSSVTACIQVLLAIYTFWEFQNGKQVHTPEEKEELIFSFFLAASQVWFSTLAAV